MTAITRYRGDTAPITGYVAIDGIPIDCTGGSIVLTVDKLKDPVGTATNVFSLVGTFTNYATGAASFPITETQADQEPGGYWFDIQFVDGLGLKRTIDKDKWVFKQDITK